MNSSSKTYKIDVNSIHFGNMRGISAMEVSKKAAKKILGSSKSYSIKLLHRPKRKMRQKIIIFSDVKAPKRLVST
jgi:hypothetical protein